MISLPQVTLIAIATQNVDATGRALEYSMQGIEFAAVKLVSPYRPAGLSESILWEHIDPFPNIDCWNEYIVYHMWKHFDTEFCLLVHSDGFVVNPQSWKEEFLAYDYIGSPFDEHTALAIQAGRDQPYSRVGNSVGIRSRRLCKLPTDTNMQWRRFNADSNEDTYISCHNRRMFEACGMRFAPLELAIHFGREAEMIENSHITEPFLFHKWHGKNAGYPRL